MERGKGILRMNYRKIRLTGCTLLLLMGWSAHADWPQWRGVARDGHTRETLPSALAPAAAPQWRLPVAHGYASPSVASGRLFLLDDAGGSETLHCLDIASGKEQWQKPVGESYTDEFEPGPRCTPLVDSDLVFVQTCRGEFQCLAVKDGNRLWRFHFSDYGAEWVSEKGANVGAASRRGNAGSPLVMGDTIYIQIGSASGASIGAFDKRTGKLKWKSQNDLTAYSSLVGGRLGGVDHLVSATVEGLLALRPADGQLLWRVPFRTGANRNALTPILANDTVYFSSHTTGLRATHVKPGGSSVSVEENWFNPQIKINLATPVLVGGYLYGQGPSRNFICVDASTGQQKWGQTGFGEVTSTITDGHRLLLLSDRGEAILTDANPEGWKELGRFQACGKTFVHPAYSDGVLYVRDSRELVAWRLGTPLP